MIEFAQNNNYLEKIVFFYVIKNKELISVTESVYFENEKISTIFKIVKQFVNTYDQIPSSENVKQVAKLKGFDISDADVDLIYGVNLDDYEPTWLEEQTEAFILYKNLNISVIDILTYLKTTSIGSNNIHSVIDHVRNFISKKINNNIVVGKDDGLDFNKIEDHYQLTKTNKFKTGYTFFDKCLGGGFEKKTLLVLQGRAKLGKSAILANLASNAVRCGNNVAICTLELSDRKYMRRIGANLLNITTDEYKYFDDTRKDLIKHKLDNFNGTLGHPAGNLWIKEFPTGTASYIDIENSLLRRQDKTGIKYDLILVDYLNLMKNDGNSNMNMYERIKRIAEGLRAIAQRNEWCVFSATQVRREYFDKEVLGMDAAAESSGLIATVDGLFSGTRDPLSDIMRVELTANRDDGFTGSSCNFKMDYKHGKMIETNEFQYYGDDDTVSLEKEMMDSYKKNEAVSAIVGQNIGSGIEIPENSTPIQVDNQSKPTDYDSILASV